MRRRKPLGELVFDLCLLAEPRARLAAARSHLAILRDHEVLIEHRHNAARLANRLAGRAGDLLIQIRDLPDAPSAVRSLAIGLIEDVNTILRESYAVLHPREQTWAPVMLLLPPTRILDAAPANDGRAA